MSCFVSLVRETKQTFCRSKEVESGQAKKDFGAKSATESLRCIYETFNRELKANAKFDSVRTTADAIRVMKDFNNNRDASQQGLKYKVLCEEIAKRINQRFGNI